MAGVEDIPERRENWAEAEFKGGAADIPAMLNRIARELGIEIVALRARVQIAWNPRAIAGAPGLDPVPFDGQP